jgi:hypothetical protein
MSARVRTAGRRRIRSDGNQFSCWHRCSGAGFYYKTFMGPRRGSWMFYEPFIRRAAGLGRAVHERDPDRYETRMNLPTYWCRRRTRRDSRRRGRRLGGRHRAPCRARLTRRWTALIGFDHGRDRAMARANPGVTGTVAKRHDSMPHDGDRAVRRQHGRVGGALRAGATRPAARRGAGVRHHRACESRRLRERRDRTPAGVFPTTTGPE